MRTKRKASSNWQKRSSDGQTFTEEHLVHELQEGEK